MTARTRKYLSISRSVRVLFLVETTVLLESGAMKTIRATYNAPTQQVDGHWYHDILAEGGGVGPISTSIDLRGGFGRQDDVRVRFITRPNMMWDTFLGQQLSISLYIPYTDDVSLIYQGVVEREGFDTGRWELFVSATTLFEFPDTPREVLDFATYPNSHLPDVGQATPIAFGDLSDDDAIQRGYLAPAPCVDVLNLRYLSPPRAKTLGAVYWWPTQESRAILIPGASQRGRVFTVPAPSTQPTDEYMQWHEVSEFPLGATVDRGAITDQGVQFSSNIQFNIKNTTYISRNPVHNRVQVVLRGYDGTTELFRETQYFFYYRSSRRWESTRNNTTQSNPRYISGNARWSLSYRYTTSPFTWGRAKTLSAAVLSRMTLTLGIAIGGSSPLVRNPNLDQSVDVYLDDSAASSAGNLPDGTPKKVYISFAHRNALSGPRQQFYSDIYQAVRGYTDRAGNYIDGGVVRRDGNMLTSPIDLYLALLRDKDGARVRAANIEVSDLAGIRNRLGTDRADGSTAIGRPLTQQDIQSFLQSFRIVSKKSAEKWKILQPGITSRALLTPHEIISIKTRRSALSDIRNRFQARYAYSHPQNRYTKHLLRTSDYTLAGTGDVSGNNLTTDHAPTGAVKGQIIHIEGGAVSTSRRIKSVRGNIIAFTGAAIAAQNDVEFWAGPYFSYLCYLSALRYGDTPTSKTDHILITDDATAQGILEREVEYYTSPHYHAEIVVPLEASRIAEGDAIFIDHPDLPPAAQASKVGMYGAGLDFASTPQTGLTQEGDTSAGVLYVDSDQPEIIRLDGQYGRGLLNTLRQSHSTGAEVRHCPLKWIAARRSIDPDRNAVTLHLEH